MHYISPDKDFRMYPGVIRGSEEWVEKYSQRTCIERTLSLLEDSFFGKYIFHFKYFTEKYYRN
jgi:hypothetical protein